MPELNIRNSKMHYREWGRGNGATVLVLHGWGADSARYEPLGSMLAEKGFHVIALDLPGWGSTSPPPCPWDVSDYVEWVHDFIEVLHNPSLSPLTLRGESDSIPPLKIRGGGGSYDDKFVLFGHSFGGRIAIKYAIKYPNELRALILCAAAGIKPPLTLKRAVFYCAAKIGRIIFKPPGLSFAGKILKRVLYHILGVNDYFKAQGIMKEVLTKTVKEDLKPLLYKITTRTLLFWGTEDQLTPYKDGQIMEQLIPDAKLITFKDERHNLPKLIPEKLAIEITKFVSSISPP